jgi:hypothetical protein
MAVIRARGVLAVLGAAALLGALALAVVPGAAPAFAGDPLVVIAAFVLAVFAALAVQRRREAERQQAPPGSPEDRRSLPRPGADIEREIAIGHLSPETYPTSPRLGERRELRPVAVDVLTRARNCSPAAAEEMLDAGTWTDDPCAAAFFSPERAEELPGKAGGVVARVLRVRPGREEVTRRTVLELAAIDEGGGGK